jgi:hypothetical protein
MSARRQRNACVLHMQGALVFTGSLIERRRASGSAAELSGASYRAGGRCLGAHKLVPDIGYNNTPTNECVVGSAVNMEWATQARSVDSAEEHSRAEQESGAEACASERAAGCAAPAASWAPARRVEQLLKLHNTGLAVITYAT